MPLVNYCRKCRAETPLGESCPYCGGKLPQTGEQISFGLMRRPEKEWFAWNNVLRVALPVWLLVWASVLAAESAAAGAQGVAALMAGGFLRTMLGLLAAVAGVLWAVLRLQGVENVHVVLNRQGVHIRTYVPQGSRLALLSHFMNEAAADKLLQEDERPELQGLVLVRRVSLPWNQIRRVRIWREESTLLFFRPTLWQAAYVRVPAQEMYAVEEYVRNRLKRSKKTKIQE